MGRVIVPFLLVLLMVGCAAKIAPGHVETVKVEKATPQMHEEPKPVEVPMPEITAEQNATEPAKTEEESAEVEEVFESGKPKKRFPRSELIASEPYKVTMKTKKFAFSDIGFLNRYDNLINLQVFTMGELAMDMVVRLDEDEICVKNLCNSKHGFNQTFLSDVYPDTLVENVLQGKPIFGGEGLKKLSKGFLQKINTKAYVIKYKIWPGNVYFKDVKNGIIIKLRKLPK